MPIRLCFVLALAWAGLAPAEAPKVAMTSPVPGTPDVNPSTREIRVIFDQDMSRDGYSFTGGGPAFPETPGRPRWVDDRTCVLPVHLKPDHAYQVGINSPRFQNFRNTKGEPAVPTVIHFHTRPRRPGEPTEDQRKRAVAELRRAIDEDYAYRDRLGVDWPATFREREPKLLAAPTPDAFAEEAAALLAPATDLHLWLKVGDRVVPSHTRSVRPNFDLNTLQRVVPSFNRSGTVLTGHYPEGIAYIHIGTWSRDAADDLEMAYEALADAKAVIIDVRDNSGGDEALARRFAGCFADRGRPYARAFWRVNGKDDGPRQRWLMPNRARKEFRGRSAILMGPANMSACESFLLMMKGLPGCTLVGERSYGSSGNPQPVPLGNGVVAFIPAWRDQQTDGTPVEGRGIAPDVEVKAGPGGFEKDDPVLDAALAILRKP